MYMLEADLFFLMQMGWLESDLLNMLPFVCTLCVCCNLVHIHAKMAHSLTWFKYYPDYLTLHPFGKLIFKFSVLILS